MFEPVTIKDIAKALGLSTSTVSRALRDTHEISEATKKLVLSYAKEINYRPNPIALSLKERRTKSIGIVVSEIANNFFSQVIDGIESIAYDKGYNIIITQTHESSAREIENVSLLASRSVDGLIVSLSIESSDSKHLKNLHDKGLPIVFFDRVATDINTHQVIANNEKGAYQATEFLIKQGRKKIAHLTSANFLSNVKERLSGYKKALADNGIEVNEEYIKYCQHGGGDDKEALTAVSELMALKDKPDAIFVAVDRLSNKCLSACKQLNLQVPEDLMIAGFSNSDVLDLFNPTMTSVRQPAFEMGQEAIKMLIQILEAKHPIEEFENKVLDTKLYVRN